MFYIAPRSKIRDLSDIIILILKTTLLIYHPTPIQEIQSAIVDDAGLRLLIKREDLNHPSVSGNKWWKLKYNLEEAQHQNKKILTFGGAFSNHIYATASAANELRIPAIGIVRGEKSLPLNPTLSFAEKMGMQLHYISREAYRDKAKEPLINSLREKFGDFYLIPEGGSNTLAVKGVIEFTKQLNINFDYLCCPVGTGGTLAGLIQGLHGEKQLIGFSILKNGEFLVDEVKRYGGDFPNWRLITEYHYGGYAKATTQLHEFIKHFWDDHQIPLEYIYTGKMFSGIFDLIAKRFFKRGSTILAIHTGGIQSA